MPEKLDELKKANAHFEKIVRELEENNRNFREQNRVMFAFLQVFDKGMKKDSQALAEINNRLASLLERIPEKKKEEEKKP